MNILTTRWLGHFKYHFKFRHKLILAFFLVIGVTSLVSGYSYYLMMSDEIESSTEQKLQTITEQIVNTLHLYLKTLDNIGISYFSDTLFQEFLDHPSTFDGDKLYRTKLSIQQMQNPLVSEIYLVRLNGELLSGNYYYNSDLKAVINQELDKAGEKAMKSEGSQFWTSSFTVPANTLVPVQTISYVRQIKRITTTSQHPVGFIKIDMNPYVLDDLFQSSLYDNDGEYYLIDREGTIIFTNDKQKIGQTLRQEPIFTSYQKIKKTAEPSSYSFQNEGKRYVGFYHHFDDNGWIFLSSASLDRILQRSNTIKRTVIWISIACFTAAMILASFIATGVTRPLKELSRKMKQVQIGNYNSFIQVTGHDEFSNIQTSFNRMTAEIRQLITKNYEIELLKKEAEIKALHSQINPHFLYNTLGTIDSISTMNGVHEISMICQTLGSLLRYNLNGETFGTIKDEVQYLDQYLSIYQLRFGKQFHYEIQIDPQIDNIVMPKFLLQPLVENAVIHGLERKPGYKEVRIAIQNADSLTLNVIIEDNGVGMDTATMDALLVRINENTLSENRSLSANRQMIGLSNVLQRIESYYHIKPEFHIRSNQEEGTTITFPLPKQIGGERLEDHDR